MRAAGDDAAMVAARADFLAGGWFDPLTAALPRTAAEAAGPERWSSSVPVRATTWRRLDALDDDRTGVAIDASVYAARRAARAHPRAILRGGRRLGPAAAARRLLRPWCWWSSPPAAGAEIARVLAPAARWWWPRRRQRHLSELAAPLGLLAVDPAKHERLRDTLEPELEQHRPPRAAVDDALDRPAAAALAAMGPSARHADPADLDRRVRALPEPVAIDRSPSRSRAGGRR